MSQETNATLRPQFSERLINQSLYKSRPQFCLTKRLGNVQPLRFVLLETTENLLSQTTPK